MPYRANYPRTVTECIDDALVFRPRTVEAVRALARARPWRGTYAEQRSKLTDLHVRLCAIYRRSTSLVFNPQDRGSSYYLPAQNVISICGRISVVTYLHEFAHALGKDERGACRWSINLFKRCFPRSFARCQHDRHMLIAPASRGSDHVSIGRPVSGSSALPSGSTAKVISVLNLDLPTTQSRVQVSH